MTINMRIMTKRVTNNYKHKRCKMRTTKIKITMIMKVTSSSNQEGGKRKQRSTWGLWLGGSRTIISTCKKCKIQTAKITIMTTKKVANNYSQEGTEKRQWSTWRLWPKRSQVVTKDVSTKDPRFKPPRSSSWRPWRSLVALAKREEKESNDQHEDHDQKGCKQL